MRSVLCWENDPAAGVTWVYTYDNAGNLLTKLQYPYSEGTLGSRIRTYTLGYTDSEWGDLQTHWCGGAFTYDAIGNLTHAGSFDYTWEHGRQLATMAGGGTTWSFAYDADGMRTSRSNGTKTYSYVYNGSSLSRMSVDGHTLDFTYDASGRPLSVTYDGTPYFYVLSLQGDVMAILDSSGTAVVTYSYSAWGTITSYGGSMEDTLGYYNPLRYRGYVYDQEVGLYYLQSRYYNAGLGRFNAPDAFTSTGQGLLGNNMFAYCLNNPVAFSDDTGAAAKVCLSADGKIDSAPWRDYSPGGGGRPHRDYSSGSNYYGEVTDKFYSVKLIKAAGNGLRKGAKSLWDAYVHSVELQAEQAYRQDMAVIEEWEDITSSPVRTGDFAFMTIGNISAYSAYVAMAATPGIGTVIAFGIAFGTAVWSTLRYYEIIQ